MVGVVGWSAVQGVRAAGVKPNWVDTRRDGLTETGTTGSEFRGNQAGLGPAESSGKGPLAQLTCRATKKNVAEFTWESEA